MEPASPIARKLSQLRVICRATNQLVSRTVLYISISYTYILHTYVVVYSMSITVASSKSKVPRHKLVTKIVSDWLSYYE
jgi:hypothetical protein